MDDGDQEIIDLTKSDEPEIIMLDDDDSAQDTSAGKESRSSNASGQAKHDISREDGEVVIVIDDDTEQQTTKPSKKRKKPRRKKKRSVVIAEGGEDGEVVEVETANNSEQVSREVSDDDSDDEERVASNASSSKKTKEGPSLLARIQDAPGPVEHDQEEDVSERNADDDSPDKPETSSKAKKKRKVREKQRVNKKPSKRNAEPSPPLDEPPPFFVDASSAELPNSVMTVLPPPALLAPLGAVEGSTSTNIDKLLLPPHVSVLELNGKTPIVEIKAPQPLDSDEEDYIDYVEYDGDQVVSKPVAASPVCSKY